MNNNKKPAKDLTAGDLFRPNADKRFKNTWYRVESIHTDGGRTSINYQTPSGMRCVMQTASLATMEID